MANPGLDQVALIGRGSVIIDDNGRGTFYTYNNITAAAPTTTLVKTGAGFLHAITFNKPVSTGTLTISDALTDTTPKIGSITTPAGGVPFTVFYDIQFTVGLTIVTGTAAQDVTIIYR